MLLTSKINKLDFHVTNKENKQATEYQSVYSSSFHLRKGRIFPNSLGGLFSHFFFFGGGGLVACPCGLVIFFPY